MTEIFTPEFIPYYIEEVEKYSLTPTEGLVYGFIRFYNKVQNRGFYFQSDDLAQIIKTTPNMIDKCLSILEKKGLIERETTHYAGGSKRLIRLSGTLLNSKNPPYQTVKPTLPNSKIKENSKIENNIKKNNIEKDDVFFENSDLNSIFIDFKNDRKNRKAPMTDLAIKLLINKVNKWLELYSVEEIIGFFEQAIESGYRSVFEKKQFAKPGKTERKKDYYETEEARNNFTF